MARPSNERTQHLKITTILGSDAEVTGSAAAWVRLGRRSRQPNVVHNPVTRADRLENYQWAG